MKSPALCVLSAGVCRFRLSATRIEQCHLEQSEADAVATYVAITVVSAIARTLRSQMVLCNEGPRTESCD